MYAYKAEDLREVLITNTKVLDFFYYAAPRSKAWKRIRVVKLVGFPVGIFLGDASIILFLSVEVGTDYADMLELGFTGLACLLVVFFILFVNVDALLMRVKTYLALADALCLLVVVALLGVYGQGFFVYGIGVFCFMYLAAYTFESIEVDTRLNLRSAVNTFYVVRQIMFVFLLLGLVCLRFTVFLKQVTVDRIELVQLSGATEAFTLRDLWEFFVDVLLVRVFYLGLDRLRQPLDSLAVGKVYAKLVSHNGPNDSVSNDLKN